MGYISYCYPSSYNSCRTVDCTYEQECVTKKRSSKKLIKVPLKFGDSVHSIRKQDTSNSKDNDGVSKQSKNDIRDNGERCSIFMEDKEKGENSGFVGDLNGEQFLTLISQVNSHSVNEMHASSDEIIANVESVILNACVNSVVQNVDKDYNNVNDIADNVNFDKVVKESVNFNVSVAIDDLNTRGSKEINKICDVGTNENVVVKKGCGKNVDMKVNDIVSNEKNLLILSMLLILITIVRDSY